MAEPVSRLRPIDLDNILDGPPADGTAGPCLPSEPQAAAVAQAHVSARVDDCVHLAVEAHCALSIPAACRLRCREGWGHRGTQWGAGGCHCRKGDRVSLMAWLSEGLQMYCSRGDNGHRSRLCLRFESYPFLIVLSHKAQRYTAFSSSLWASESLCSCSL